MQHFRAQELCESRGGRPGLPAPSKPYGFCGCEATFEVEGRVRIKARRVVYIIISTDIIILDIIILVISPRQLTKCRKKNHGRNVFPHHPDLFSVCQRPFFLRPTITGLN